MKSDKDIIKERLESEIILPESLKAENIERLIEKEGVKKSKGNIRRFTSLAVAASIMIISVFGVLNRDRLFPVLSPVTEESTASGSEYAEASDYSELISFIKKYAEENKDKYDNRLSYYFTADDSIAADTEEAVKAPAVNSTVQADSVYGVTNVREEGVNESDLFITDGEYFYFLTNSNSVEIVKANPDGSFTHIKTFSEKLSDREGLWYNGVYKYKNYLIAEYRHYKYDNLSDDGIKSYNGVYYDSYWQSSSDGGVKIYDISEPENAYLVKDISLEGELISSRITDGKIVLVNQFSVSENFYKNDDSLLVPAIYFDGEKELVASDSVCYSESDAPETYVTTAFIDLEDGQFSTQTLSVLGIAGTTYCTEKTLYITATDYSLYKSNASYSGVAVMINPAGLNTKITKIDISSEAPVLKCKGEIEGTLLNSYSIDEYNGFLRIAASKDTDNRVYILNEELKEVGRLEKIAEGENIKSVRFSGDTAYVVTFLQTDPLFVIDLKNPEKPEITGELKIPGFSSYLHPVGENLLVGIGQGGTEDGVDGSAKISLFDVSDPHNPIEKDSLIIKTADFMYESKAYTAVSENSFLIPITKWNVKSVTDDIYVNYRTVTGSLYVSAENGELILKNAYISACDGDTERVTFINDRVYHFSSYGGLCSFDMESGEFLYALTLNSNSEGFSKLTENATELLF